MEQYVVVYGHVVGNVIFLRRYTDCLCKDKAEAIYHRNRFNRKYPGKPYPNGLGVYPFTRAWITPVLSPRHASLA